MKGCLVPPFYDLQELKGAQPLSTAKHKLKVLLSTSCPLKEGFMRVPHRYLFTFILTGFGLGGGSGDSAISSISFLVTFHLGRNVSVS